MKKRNHIIRYCPVFLSTTGILINLLVAPISMAEDENEETYSIDLVQTAEVAKEIVELGNKKVLAETYTAKEGDHIWQLLRNRDLLKSNKLGGVLAALKKLNPSLTNIDMIHPGEKIIIPLVITPITGRNTPDNISDLETISLSDMENLEFYTVNQGDSLIKVINKKYSIPGDELYSEYLNQLKKLNPDIKDLDHILPGQKIRLPIYSPKIVRGTIEEKSQKPKKDTEAMRLKVKEIGDNLNRIFTLIGEEWMQEGKHIIPLKTGGQIDFDTEDYPIINLRNGDQIIVDLFDNLSDKKKVSELIRSDWDNYQIVNLTEKDNLKDAVAKVLSACNYNKIYAEGESLEFEAGFKIELKADWIIKVLPEASSKKDNTICLNIIDERSGTAPSSLKNFLAGHGIKIIDYPPEYADKEDKPVTSNAVGIEENRNDNIEKILELAGQKYSKGEDIPIYQKKDSDFNLTAPADYFFKRNGRDCIIDLNGLGSDIVALLKEHKFKVLSLAGESRSYKVIAKTLDFLGIKFEDKNHTFYTISGDRKENIKIIVPGILFKDARGHSDFFSSINLPPDIYSVLSMKVDNIFYFKPAIKAE